MMLINFDADNNGSISFYFKWLYKAFSLLWSSTKMAWHYSFKIWMLVTQPQHNHLYLCLLTSNNQRLEKCIWSLLLLNNWNLPFFFWLTYYRHGHDLVLLEFTIIKEAWDGLNLSCPASDRYHHEIEAKCVSLSKMAAKDWNDLVSMITTHGTL